MTPNATDNNLPIPTVTPNPILRTSTIEATGPLSQPLKLPTGEVFFWSVDHAYIQLSNFSNQDPNVVEHFSGRLLNSKSVALKPDQAIDLAFAAYQPNVAYLTSVMSKPGEPRELWIADPRMENVNLVWIDSTHWLGDIDLVTAHTESEVIWGPYDRYVLITSYVEEIAGHMVIYDLEKQKAELVEGTCGTISFSLQEHSPEIWCRLQHGRDNIYAVLTSDGLQIESQPPKSILSESLAWRLSPDNQRVVFLGENDHWFITDIEGNPVRLPIRYKASDDVFYHAAGARNIVWSADGKRILLYGEDESQNYCPPRESEYTGESQSWPCWLLIDSDTKSVIWWPDLAMQQENTVHSFNMSMSPNGEWLMFTVSNPNLGHNYSFILIHVPSRSSQKIPIDPFLLPAFYIQWY